MKYVSIDIETAGLNKHCSILEFGAVIDDLSKPITEDELIKFHTYVTYEDNHISGEPYALAMHQRIFHRIAKHEEGYNYTPWYNLGINFKNWLKENGYEETNGVVRINVAGKNFAMFDKNFLEPIFEGQVEFVHRVLDPVMLYFRKGDKGLPSASMCMERAGLEGEVAHTALEDAILVVKLLRRGLNWYYGS
jgi:DNA polymerase III epsilon subunit-like protein